MDEGRSSLRQELCARHRVAFYLITRRATFNCVGHILLRMVFPLTGLRGQPMVRTLTSNLRGLIFEFNDI